MNLSSLLGDATEYTLELPTGDRVRVTAHGGQVLHWRVDGGEELLYLSPDASSDEGRAIRGGIPVCWPQFNTRGPLPKHGFARHAVWRLHGQDDTSLLLELTPSDLSDEQRAAWPHHFQLRQKIDLAPGQLTVTLDVSNLGQAPFEFTTALHTYLRVDDVAQAQLGGWSARGCGTCRRRPATRFSCHVSALRLTGSTTYRRRPMTTRSTNCRSR